MPWIQPHWIRTGARVVRNSSPAIEPDSEDVPMGTVGTLLDVVDPLPADQELRVEMPGLGVTFHYELSSLLEEWGSIDVTGPPVMPGVPEWIQIGALVECFTPCTVRRYCTLPTGVVAQVMQVQVDMDEIGYDTSMGLDDLERMVWLDVEGERWEVPLHLFEGCWRRYALPVPVEPLPEVYAPTAHERLLDD